MSGLRATGERVIEDAYQSDPGRQAIYAMHIASYRFALPFTRGRRVLDLGCGSGYGAAMVADSATSVTAVDVSQDALAYAAEHFSRPNLAHMGIVAGRPLPFDDHSFEVVLSFQVIEHVEDDGQYVREAWRVLCPGGVFIVITPNRGVRLFRWQKPWNRWHVREYDEPSLSALFRANPWTVEMRHMGAGPALYAKERTRYSRLKWATLPFTLPFVPDALRVRGLGLLHAFDKQGSRPAHPLVFDDTHVVFGVDDTSALNLVAIATRPGT